MNVTLNGNDEVVLLPSAARTSTTSTSNQTSYGSKGVMVELNVTAASGTGGLTVRIVGVINGTSHILASTSAQTAVGKYLLELYPGTGATSDEVTKRQSGALPKTWFAQVSHGDATSYTYSLGASLLI